MPIDDKFPMTPAQQAEVERWNQEHGHLFQEAPSIRLVATRRTQARCTQCGQLSSTSNCYRCIQGFYMPVAEHSTSEPFESTFTPFESIDHGLPETGVTQERLESFITLIEAIKAGREPEDDFEETILRAIKANEKRDRDERLAIPTRFARLNRE